MEPFNILTSKVVPLDIANIDTDALMPKQFMKTIRRTGLGNYLFDEWRFTDPGVPGKPIESRTVNPAFPLNKPELAGARIILARENFGCGSSREHACWALQDYGIRVIVAPSFADIFFNNCFKNGLLPISLPPEVIDGMFAALHERPDAIWEVDLPSQRIRLEQDTVIPFEIDEYRKHCLVHALDDISITLQSEEDIRRYEQARQQRESWLFPQPGR